MSRFKRAKQCARSIAPWRCSPAEVRLRIDVGQSKSPDSRPSDRARVSHRRLSPAQMPV